MGSDDKTETKNKIVSASVQLPYLVLVQYLPASHSFQVIFLCGCRSSCYHTVMPMWLPRAHVFMLMLDPWNSIQLSTQLKFIC